MELANKKIAAIYYILYILYLWECVYARECMYARSHLLEKTREQQSRKREARECRASCMQSVKSFHSVIIKSEFDFGNHII